MPQFDEVADRDGRGVGIPEHHARGYATHLAVHQHHRLRHLLDQPAQRLILDPAGRDQEGVDAAVHEHRGHGLVWITRGVCSEHQAVPVLFGAGLDPCTIAE